MSLTFESFLLHAQALNSGIISAILRNLDTRSIYALSETSPSFEHIVAHYSSDEWDVILPLSKFVHHKAFDLLSLLHHTGSIIGGLLPMQIITSSKPLADTLEIFVPLAGASEVAQALERWGYRFRPASQRQSIPNRLNTIADSYI